MKQKLFALLLSFVMLVNMVPPFGTIAMAAEGLSCEHHPVHTAECSYAAAVEAHDCTHVCGEDCKIENLSCAHTHDEACGYVPAVAEIPESACTHSHDGSCGYAPAVPAQEEAPCGHVHDDSCAEACSHTHDESCGYAPAVAAVEGAACTHAHDGLCGYAPAVPGTAEIPCVHEHTEACYTVEMVCSHQHDESCGENGSACGHSCDSTCQIPVIECSHTEHDDICGYAEAVEGSPCTFVCEECAPCEICGEQEGHLEDCSEYVCPDCGEQGSHLEGCPAHICSECGIKGGHLTDCSALLYTCDACGRTGGHDSSCPYYVLPATFGKNPSFVGVGPLLGDLSQVKVDDDTQAAIISAKGVTTGNAKTLLKSMAKEGEAEGNTENSDSENAVSPDGSVNATKSVVEWGTADDGKQIFKINLKAETETLTTGESCDFVMVLDMSYSMTGENLVALKQAATQFVTDLYSRSKFSRVAIVTYGGNQNANRFYIRAYNGAAYLTASGTDNNTCVYEKYSGTDGLKQLWSIESVGNGFVRIVNAANGQVLTANTASLSHKNWPNVKTTDYENTPQQQWRQQNFDGYVMFQSAMKCVNGHPTYLDLADGKTENGTTVGMWETAGNPTRWVLEPPTTVAYETYYWTDSTNATGYSYRTDHSAADSSFLVVSQNEGEQINQKLLDAINALTVYGQPNEGSHPGEAMEKATRIYQAVHYDDANDICDVTKEHYYEKKRGVLYFADGTPSPTDEKELNYYPGNNAQGLNHYGVEYDFVKTYWDAQDASNWSIVLKSEKGQSVSHSFTNYFINKGSLHTRDEYYDIGSTSITGCGAAVYVLGTNLPTMDVTTCTLSHTHDWRTVLDGKGNSVQVCYAKVYDKTYGLFDSYDSRTNEFFYRLSSHRVDGSHIFTGTTYQSEIEQKWTDELYNSSYCTETISAWNGRYPDIICRNQTLSYFVACDDQEAIMQAFTSIVQQVGSTLKDLKLKDYISEYYEICDQDGKLLPAGTEINTDTYTGIIGWDEQKGRQYIEWTGIELSGGAAPKDFDESFFVIPKDDFLGGNNVVTNDGATITKPNGDALVEIPNPDVNIDVSVDKISNITLESRAGAAYIESIPYSDLLQLITIKVGKNGEDEATLVLNPSEPNFGLESWQDEFVNIKIAYYNTQVDSSGNQLYGEDGLPLQGDEILEGGHLNEVRRDHAVLVQIWIWPKTDENGNTLSATAPPDNAHTARGVVNIKIYYPTFVFNDVTLYHGQPLSLATEAWGEEMDATPYLQWYTNKEYKDLLANPQPRTESPGYVPLPEGSWGKDAEVVVQETPEVYFKVDPIDATLQGNHTGAVDDHFYEKFGTTMGKEQVDMNVRVFYRNEDDSGDYNPDDPTGTADAMRNAFFLHVDTRGNTIRKHTSGSQNNYDMYWGTEFRILPAYCELTIEKVGGLPGETYIFTVARGQTNEYSLVTGEQIQSETEPVYYTTVSITTDANGYGSVTLTELPVGVYTVTEDMDWSWRFKDSEPTYSWKYENGTPGTGTKIYLLGNADQDTATVTVTNSSPNDRWLSGMSAVVENIFGRKKQ